MFVNSGNRIGFAREAAAQDLFGADEAALLGRSPLERMFGLDCSRRAYMRAGAAPAALGH
jgi:hypothetical protein